MNISFSVIDRLLFKETAKVLIIIVAILILLVFSNIFVKILGQVASGAIKQEVVFAFASIYVLKTLGLIIPPAFFLSILLVLGRMYRDGEITALESAGVGPLRLYRAFFLSAIPLSIFVGWLVLSVLPWGKGYIDQLKDAGENEVSLAIFQAGKFIESNRGNLVVFTEAITNDGLGLQGVFVQDRQNNQLGLVTAEQAYQRTDPETGEQFVILEDGQRYQGLPGSYEYSVGEFDEYAFRLPESELGGSKESLSTQSWQTLWQSDQLKAKAELQYRLSFPLAIFAFTLVSVPLARSLPRQGVYGRLSIAIVIYFVFVNLQRVAENWMADGVTPSWLGMWWLPLTIMLIAMAIIYYDKLKFERRLPAFIR